MGRYYPGKFAVGENSVGKDFDRDLAYSQFNRQTLLDVMQAVAEQYYPNQKDALLEIKLPDLLKVIDAGARVTHQSFGMGRELFIALVHRIKQKSHHAF